jgi:ribosomal protein L40E
MSGEVGGYPETAYCDRCGAALPFDAIGRPPYDSRKYDWVCRECYEHMNTIAEEGINAP